jgi:hypothetical protein
MARTMGDATHAAVPELAAIRSQLQLVAGYDTGSPDVDWTAADWALFPGIPHVTIDQGFTGSPNLTATVRDVEFGAWQPGQAVNLAGWNVARPTIYCTTGETGYNLAAVLADGWRGDLWLAIAGWQPGQPLPAAPGCTIVAVQNDYSNPAYDRSVVLDPVWPGTQEDQAVVIPGLPAGTQWATDPVTFVDTTNGTSYYVGQGTDGTIWMTKFVSGAWTTPVRL